MLLLTLSTVSCQSVEVSKDNWVEVWKDEFNYIGLPDSSRWNFDTEGNAWDWGNKESQFYTKNDTSNAYVDGEFLIITARRKRVGKKKYTSSRLTSQYKGDWKYGKLEIRAKVPQGDGTWPAIWMLPSNDTYGDWPNSGEIDIMEYVGSDTSHVFGTIHTKSFNHVIGTERSAAKYIENVAEDFHIYGIEWEEEEIRFYVDEKLYFTYKKEGETPDEWPFDQKFHILLNLAIGGEMGGTEGIDDSLFPHEFVIDYVRVFQRL